MSDDKRLDAEDQAIDTEKSITQEAEEGAELKEEPEQTLMAGMNPEVGIISELDEIAKETAEGSSVSGQLLDGKSKRKIMEV
ncbi:MAG TPA: hypothetical protein VIL66_09550, partial [Bacillota bacterium]